jgi:hypothetical protein
VPVEQAVAAARAAQLISEFAQGGHVLDAAVGSGLANIRAYGATNGAGYAFMLFNLDPSASTSVSAQVAHATRTTFTGKATVYGKAQYDTSQNDVWTAPVTTSLGSVGASLDVSLPPWSMTLLELQ